jgi:mannan endo-1,4-beta-mannosidase
MASTGGTSGGRPFRRVWVAVCALALGLVGTNVGVLPTAPAVASAPTSGALFGVFPGRNPGGLANCCTGPDLVTYLPAMNRWQGRPNGVINTFGPIADTNNTFLNYFPTIWNTHKAVPMYSITANDYTNQQIVDGATDSDLDRFRTELDKWIHGADVTGVQAPPGGRRVYLRLHIEPNTDVLYPKHSPGALASDCAQLAVQEQLYIDSWRHIYDKVMQPGLFTANQVQWVFSMYYEDVITKPALQNCANGASDITGHIFPGDAYVDWLGIDGFTIQGAIGGAPDLKTPAQIFDTQIAKLRSMSSRPMSFDEVGTSTTADTNVVFQTTAWKDQWLKSYFDYMQAKNVRMSIYNNMNGAPVDWAVFTPDDGEAVLGPTAVGSADILQSRGSAQYTDAPVPVTYNVYKEYKAGVNRSYFTAPDPTDPRLISDPVFKGSW